MFVIRLNKWNWKDALCLTKSDIQIIVPNACQVFNFIQSKLLVLYQNTRTPVWISEGSFTNFMEQSTSWETYSHSVSAEIPLMEREGPLPC
jgi:hypothetical protein